MDQNHGRQQKPSSRKLKVFQNRCLRRILKIFWPNTISNRDLHARTSTDPIEQLVQQRRWRYIGHTLRKEPTALPRVAHCWTPAQREKQEDRKKRGEELLIMSEAKSHK